MPKVTLRLRTYQFSKLQLQEISFYNIQHKTQNPNEKDQCESFK